MTLNETITQSVSERSSPTRLGALGVLVVTVAFGRAAGPVGVLAGGALALCWYRLPTAYAYALGHIALVALVPKTAPLTTLASVEMGLFLALVGPAAVDDSPARPVASAAGCFLGLLAVGWAVRTSTDGLWPAAGATLGCAALLAYAVHRYELVRFGFVEAEP